MNRKRLGFLITAAVAFSAGGGALAARLLNGHNSQSPLATPNDVTIADSDLDLGEQDETASYRHTFNIINKSSTPLTVVRFAGSCDCRAAEPLASLTIPPGGLLPVRASLVLSSASPCQRGSEAPGAARIPISVRLRNAAGKEFDRSWSFRYLPHRTVRVVGGVVNLGLVSVRGLPTAEHDVEFEAASQVRSLLIPDRPDWSASPCEVTEAPTRRIRAKLVWRGPPRIGPIHETLTVTPIGNKGEHLQSVPVEVIGESVEDVIPRPRTACLGRHPVSSRITESVQIVSLTNRRLVSFDPVLVPKGVTLNVVREANGQATANIAVEVLNVGEQEVVTEFWARDEAGERTKVVLPIRYLGCAR